MDKPKRKITLEEKQDVLGVDVRLAKAGEFRPQRVNANSHTPRGMGMLGDAINSDGYVAPMTAAANGEIIDGSARMEVAPDRLGEDVIVIEHDGRRPIVAVRTDIADADTDAAKRIAIAANRIAEVNLAWDPEVLKSLEDIDLNKYFLGWELAKIGLGTEADDPNAQWKGMPELTQEDLSAWKSIRVNFNSVESLKAFAELIGQPLTENTRSIWYPAAERVAVKNIKEYSDES